MGPENGQNIWTCIDYGKDDLWDFLPMVVGNYNDPKKGHVEVNIQSFKIDKFLY